jgi:hypothetical protein
MTHRGGLSLSIIIWRIGGGSQSFLLPWGPNILLVAIHVTDYTQSINRSFFYKAKEGCHIRMLFRNQFFSTQFFLNWIVTHYQNIGLKFNFSNYLATESVV